MPTPILREQTEVVETADGPMGVYLVRPEGDGPYPVVVSYHHGPGLDAGSKEAMAMIAGWGYYVISHDRYHREQEWLVFDRSQMADEDARRRFFGILIGTTDDKVDADLGAVLDFVAADPAAKDGAMGCIGYCIGGRSVLRTMAWRNDVFRAGVALHPSFCTTADADSPHLAVPTIEGTLYVGFGAEDKSQSPADNQAFIDATTARPTGEVEVHDGADHGFAVPGPGWHEAAATRSYERAKAAFEREL